jgi:hypothetical protein
MRALDAAHLAGFLDGDGSIIFQFVRQDGYKFGYYIRSTLQLSQSTSARHGLEHLRSIVGGGYIRDRGTGMSDLVVTSRPLITAVLLEVQPYVVFKQLHVVRALDLLARLRPRMDADEFLEIAWKVDAFAALNYSKSKRVTAADVEQHLRSKGLCAPVTTPLQMPTQRDEIPV